MRVVKITKCPTAGGWGGGLDVRCDCEGRFGALGRLTGNNADGGLKPGSLFSSIDPLMNVITCLNYMTS